MFGISFTEIFVIAVVTLVVVGPQKLPAMLGTLGKWAGKLRRISTEMRQQTGIDDLLRQEGLHGGLSELKSLMRGQANHGGPARRVTPMQQDPVEFDRSREYPVEGPDCYNAVADDLLDDDDEPPSSAASQSAVPSPYPEADPSPSDASEASAPDTAAPNTAAPSSDGSATDSPAQGTDEPAGGSRS